MNLATPEVNYARSGDISIAYQVVGSGPRDILFVPFLIKLIWAWEQPIFVDFCTRLAEFSRLILLDKRGTGLSDRPRDLPGFETKMDDLGPSWMLQAQSEPLSSVPAPPAVSSAASSRPPTRSVSRRLSFRTPGRASSRLPTSPRRHSRRVAAARAGREAPLGRPGVPAGRAPQIPPELRRRPGLRAVACQP